MFGVNGTEAGPSPLVKPPATPLGTADMARLSAEMWEVIKDKDWASIGGGGGRLWNADKFYQSFGGGGAGAVGSGLPIAVGAALAHRNAEALTLARTLLTATPQRADQGFAGAVLRTGQSLLIPVVSPDALAAGGQPDVLQHQ